MKLITPTFEESAHFHNPMLSHGGGANTSLCYVGAAGPFYEDLAAISI